MSLTDQDDTDSAELELRHLCHTRIEDSISVHSGSDTGMRHAQSPRPRVEHNQT
jgi:hypothetical protein